jgi:hypothetical protein
VVLVIISIWIGVPLRLAVVPPLEAGAPLPPLEVAEAPLPVVLLPDPLLELHAAMEQHVATPSSSGRARTREFIVVVSVR